MSVTMRFVALAAGGCLLVALAHPFGLSLHAFFLANTAAFGLLLVDMLVTPSPDRIQVSRELDGNLYFRAENVVRFLVKNESAHSLRIEAKEDANRYFRVTDGSGLLRAVEPGLQQVFSYETLPTKRGSFLFEAVYIRYAGVLGLCRRHARLPAPMEYKVYPDVRDLGKYRLLAQRNRHLPAGDSSVRHAGLGHEFESLRPYVEGDDYRAINWQATAREMRPVVNTFRIERSQPVMILVDMGRPMSYRVRGFSKLDHAVGAAVILADIVNSQGDRAGAAVFGRGLSAYVPPGQGPLHRNRLLETLYKIEPDRDTSDFQGACKALCDRQKRRSLVFIFTDFELMEEGEELARNIGWLKKKHLPVLVFMKNEELARIAAKSLPEKSGPTYERTLRDTAGAALEERREVFRRLAALGVPSVECPPEDFALAAVNRYLMLRR